MPSFPRYLFTVLPKMLVFPGIFDVVDGIWRVSLGRSVRCDHKNARFPKDFSVLPKMLVFLGILGMVDGMCLIFPGILFVHGAPKNACFPRDF